MAGADKHNRVIVSGKFSTNSRVFSQMKEIERGRGNTYQRLQGQGDTWLW